MVGAVLMETEQSARGEVGQTSGVRLCNSSPKCVWLLAAFLDLVLFTLVLNAEVLIFYAYVNIVQITHTRGER